MSHENSELKYSDFYDRLTVEKCRRLVKSFEEGDAEVPVDDPQREAKIAAHKTARWFLLWHTTGERAAKKAERIREWLARDARQEQLVANAEPRSDIYCLRCREQMQFMDKHLESSDKGDRVLLFYECPKGCLPRRAFYNDGSEFRSNPRVCTKCHSSVSEKSTRNGDLIIIASTCEKCGHTETEEMDLSPRKEKVDEHFTEDRLKYCLSDDELRKYQDGMRNMEAMARLGKEFEEEKRNTRTEEQIINIKKLRVIEIQELLTKTLEGLNFVKVEISNPNTSEGIRVKLTALDNDRKRSDSGAMKTAKDALEMALQETNWRLVKNSLSSTLGTVMAELRGYVSEIEIRQLFEAEAQ